MLRREDGRGHQDRHLRAGLDGLEGGAQGDLGLAVADVAHDEAVHGRVPLEVGLDLDGGAQLVGRLLVGEGRLHLRLPGRVLAEGPAVGAGTLGVERQQVAGQVADGLADARPGALPLPSPEPAELRVLAAGVAGDALDLLDGHPDATGLGEVQLQEVALLAARAAGRAPHEARVARHAVVDVDDDVAGLEALEQVAGHDPAHGPRPAHADGAEELAVGDEDEAVRAAGEAAVEAALDERQRRPVGSGSWRTLDRARRRCRRRPGSRRDGPTGRRPARPGHPRPPAAHRRGQRADGRRRQDRLVPAEGVAARAARPSASGSQVSSSVRAASEGPLPVARPGVGRRPARRQLAGPLQLRAPLLGLLVPGSSATAAIVAGLVDQPDGLAEVVEGGGRRQVAAPQLRGVAERAVLEAREVRRSASGSRAAWRPRRSRSASRRAAAQEELAGRQERPPPRRARCRAGRPGRRRAATRPRRRTTRRAPARAGRPGRRRGCRRAARTRRDRRPRARARSRGRRASAPRRPWRRRLPRRRVSGSAGMSSGAMVRWKSAWRLATRMRGAAVGRRQAARAATRAADSSRTSSERS